MLEATLGIVADESIMHMYNGFFFTAMLIDTVVFAMNVMSPWDETPCPVNHQGHSEEQNRVMIASFSLQILETAVFFCAQITMLVMISKFSSSLEQGK